MSVLHRIHIPGGPQPEPIPSPIGQWESAAGEVHKFYEPMVQLTVSIDDDHTLHLFCEASQVERVPGVLMELVRRGFRMRAEEFISWVNARLSQIKPAEATLAMLDELVDGVEGRP